MIGPSRRIAMFLPSLTGGGAERVVLNMAIGFAQRGFSVDLVLARAEGPYLSMVPPEIRIVDLKASRVLFSIRPLVSYLRRETPAVLLSALDYANVVAITAARMARVGTRTVVTIHCTFPRGATDLRDRAAPWLLGKLNRWADVIVAVSRGVADDVVRVTGIPRWRIDVIYNPVIMPTLQPAAAAPPTHPWFTDERQHPVVLGVGRLTPQKNFALLIDAFAIVRKTLDVRLVILGEGPEREALQERIDLLGLGDVVALAGFVDNPYACMARASVLALSSNFEGLPTVVIESLALGTPVVATDCESGPREILQNGTLGDLVPVGNVEALASAIASTLNRRERVSPVAALAPYTLDAALDRFQVAFAIHG